RVASGTDDGIVSVWDPGQDVVVTTQTMSVNAVVALPDGRIAFADSGNVRVWDPGSARSQRRVGHRWFVSSVSFLDDGRVISLSQGGNSLCLWDPDRGRLLGLHQPAEGIHAVRVLPDGRAVLWK